MGSLGYLSEYIHPTSERFAEHAGVTTSPQGPTAELSGSAGAGPGERRSFSRFRRLSYAVLCAVVGTVLVFAVYAQVRAGGVKRVVLRIPAVADLFHVTVLPMEPFIVPISSPKASYALVTVELLVEKGREDRVAERLPLIRGAIYHRLAEFAREGPPEKARFQPTVSWINARLGAAVLRDVWVKRGRDSQKGQGLRRTT